MRYGDIDSARRLARYFIHERQDPVPFLEFANEPDWGWEEDLPSYPDQALRFHKELAPLFPD